MQYTTIHVRTHSTILSTGGVTVFEVDIKLMRYVTGNISAVHTTASYIQAIISSGVIAGSLRYNAASLGAILRGAIIAALLLHWKIHF